MGTEHEHPVPRVQEDLAEEQLEDLRPGPRHDVRRSRGQPVFVVDVLGNRLTEFGKSG
jgi:hypothetical protein